MIGAQLLMFTNPILMCQSYRAALLFISTNYAWYFLVMTGKKSRQRVIDFLSSVSLIFFSFPFFKHAMKSSKKKVLFGNLFS